MGVIQRRGERRTSSELDVHHWPNDIDALRESPASSQRRSNTLLTVRNVGQAMLAVSSKCVRVPHAFTQSKVCLFASMRPELAWPADEVSLAHSAPCMTCGCSRLVNPPSPTALREGVRRRATSRLCLAARVSWGGTWWPSSVCVLSPASWGWLSGFADD